MSKAKNRRALSKANTSLSNGESEDSASPGRAIPRGSQEFALIAHQERMFSGPLPSPDILAGYEKTFPGAAERIISMAEAQAAHRQRIEHISVSTNSKNQTVGVWFGGLISLSILGVAAYLASLGVELWALAMVVLEMAGLGGVFVYAKRVQRKDLQQKRKALEALAESAAKRETQEDDL